MLQHCKLDKREAANFSPKNQTAGFIFNYFLKMLAKLKKLFRQRWWKDDIVLLL